MSHPLVRKPGRPKDEQLAERRRADILTCAIQHFARVGYHAADLDQIAAELGCAKGTLYHYFPTKRDLFEAAVDRIMTDMCEVAESAKADDLIEELEESMRLTLAFFDAHPEYVELLIQERAVFRDRAKPSFFEYSERHVESCRAKLCALMKDGRVRQMSIDSLTEVGGKLLYGTIFTNYFARRSRSYQKQAEEINDILWHGVLSPEESERRKKENRGGGA